MAAAAAADKVQLSQKGEHFLQRELIEGFFLPEPFWLFAWVCLKHKKFIGGYK